MLLGALFLRLLILGFLEDVGEQRGRQVPDRATQTTTTTTTTTITTGGGAGGYCDGGRTLTQDL